MALTSTRIRKFWDFDKRLAFVLVALGTFLTVWSGMTHQGPGVSIGLLALAAGIMSIRPEMHIFERMAWVTILVALASLEVRAIQRSDRENSEAKRRQIEQFQEVLGNLQRELQITKDGFDATGQGIAGSISALGKANEQSRRQFVATMNKANGIAATTQQSLDAFAGTGSVPCVTVKRQEGARPDVLLVLSSFGKNNLTGITVQIAANTTSTRELTTVLTKEVSVVSPGAYIEVGHLIPVLRKDGDALYFITITAQNGVYEETLSLRKPSIRWTFQQSQFSIRRVSPGNSEDLGVCKHSFGEGLAIH